MRAFVIYLFIWVSMSFFGGEVCPFLDDLSLLVWSATLLIGVVPVFLVRLAIDRLVMRPAGKIPAGGMAVNASDGLPGEQPRSLRRFLFEFGMILAVGLIV